MFKLLYILSFSLLLAGPSELAWAEDAATQQALATHTEAQVVQDDDLPDGDLDLPDGDFDEEPAADEVPADDNNAEQGKKNDKDKAQDQADTPKKDSHQPTADDADKKNDAADDIPPGPGEDDAIPDLEPLKAKDDQDDASSGGRPDGAASPIDKPREDVTSPWDEEENHATRPVIGGGVHEVEIGGSGRVSQAEKDGDVTDEAWFWPVAGGGGAVVVIAAAIGGGFLVYSMLNADKGSVTIVLE